MWEIYLKSTVLIPLFLFLFWLYFYNIENFFFLNMVHTIFAGTKSNILSKVLINIAPIVSVRFLIHLIFYLKTIYVFLGFPRNNWEMEQSAQSLSRNYRSLRLRRNFRTIEERPKSPLTRQFWRACPLYAEQTWFPRWRRTHSGRWNWKGCSTSEHWPRQGHLHRYWVQCQQGIQRRKCS